MTFRITPIFFLGFALAACSDRIVQPGDGQPNDANAWRIAYTAFDSANIDHVMVVLTDSIGGHSQTLDTASLRYSVGKNCILWRSSWVMSPLTLARRDGSIIRRIYPERDPLDGGAVSPDGLHITYCRTRTHPPTGTAILILESTDGSSSVVIDSSASAYGQEVFTPDNSAVVYERRTDSGTRADLVRYTIASRRSQTLLYDIKVVGPFAVSPRGDIAYVSSGEVFGTCQVVTSEGIHIATLADVAFPSWSPDGKKFIYCTSAAIMISYDNGTTADPLVISADTPYMPTWSEDGTQLLYGLVHSDQGNVVRTDLYQKDFTWGTTSRIAAWALYGFYLR